ncbi:hypothetical protein C7S15_4383 [Burkholderia cepacia]|nr:hypothetical protein [Burkholderia cepacia]
MRQGRVVSRKTAGYGVGGVLASHGGMTRVSPAGSVNAALP